MSKGQEKDLTLRLTIRPARHDDADVFLQIENENFTDPWSRAVFLETMDNPLYLNLAAVLTTKTETGQEDRKTVGFLCLALVADEGHIDNVSVSRTCRRLGIGEKLLTEALQQGREKGALAFTLEVRAGNVPARSLYEKAGFTCEGIRKNYYTHPSEDAAIYWKYA